MSHILGFSQFNESGDYYKDELQKETIRFLQNKGDVFPLNKEFIEHIQTTYGELIGRLKPRAIKKQAERVVSTILDSGDVEARSAAYADMVSWIKKIKTANFAKDFGPQKSEIHIGSVDVNDLLGRDKNK